MEPNAKRSHVYYTPTFDTLCTELLLSIYRHLEPESVDVSCLGQTCARLYALVGKSGMRINPRLPIYHSLPKIIDCLPPITDNVAIVLAKVASEQGLRDNFAYLIQSYPLRDYSYTFLKSASICGHLPIIERIYSHYSSIKYNGPEEHVHNLVCHAARNGHLVVIQYFCHTHAASVTYFGSSALRLAAKYGHLSTVQWLYDRGGLLTAPHPSELSTIFLAARKGHLPLVQWLYHHDLSAINDKDYLLCHASSKGHLHVVKWLYKQGASVTFEGSTPIVWAAKKGRLKVVEWLYAHGASITAQDNMAIFEATCYNHMEMVQWLFAHGASITCDDNLLICVAAARGHLELVKWLYAQGATITACNNYALRWATKKKHTEVIKWLLDHGASLNE